MGNIRIKGFIVWSRASTCLVTSYKRMNYFLSYVRDYWYDKHNQWVFLPNYSVPMSLQQITNEIEPEWIYDSTANALLSDDTERRSYKLEWLSTQITIYSDHKHTEYDMDDFMSTFRIVTGNTVPKLSMIYICWCIYTKQWFPSTATITFTVIDSNGDTRYLAVDQYCTIRLYKN